MKVTGKVCLASGETWTVDGDGNVANSSGDVVAVVVELILDLSAARLMGGGGHGPAVKADLSESDSGTPPTNAHPSASSDATTRVWGHYQRVIPGAQRQTLESKRRTIIRNALKVRGEAECCRAIDGLARSPHHNGQNEQRKKYLGIQYALRGIAAEGNDERIDKMMALASPSADGTISAVPSGQREMVRNRQRQVEDKLLHPGDATRAARAGDSERILREQYGLRAFIGSEGRVEWLREAGL